MALLIRTTAGMYLQLKSKKTRYGGVVKLAQCAPVAAFGLLDQGLLLRVVLGHVQLVCHNATHLWWCLRSCQHSKAARHGKSASPYMVAAGPTISELTLRVAFGRRSKTWMDVWMHLIRRDAAEARGARKCFDYYRNGVMTIVGTSFEVAESHQVWPLQLQHPAVIFQGPRRKEVQSVPAKLCSEPRRRRLRSRQVPSG